MMLYSQTYKSVFFTVPELRRESSAKLTVLLLHLPSEIARHFRFGSQEDAHEFLRYTIDAMQKACLNGYPK